MPKILSSRVLPRHQLSKLLKKLQSSRKSARVVTPGGVAPRGNPSSWKSAAPRFQSLVEEDAQRVVEIAGGVTAYETHPVTLDLGSEGDKTRYTPDLIVWFEDYGAVVEIKPERKLSSPKTIARLKRVTAQLQHHGIPLCLMLDTDVRAHGLQRTLKLLQRERPARGRFREGLDTSLWDPLGRHDPTNPQLERWEAAKKACDELLARVMRRDPDELISTNAR